MKRHIIASCLVFGLFLLLSLAFMPRVSAQTSATVTPTASPTASNGPDLIITGISWTRTNPGIYPATFSFRATIKNAGNAASPAGVIHDVKITLGGLGSGQVMSTSYTQSILPGVSVSVPGDTTWTTNVLHNFYVTGSVDVGGRIVEMNESNNYYTSPTQIILEPTPRPTTPAPTSTKTSTPTPTSGASQPDLSFPVSASWIWDPKSYDSVNGCYNYMPVLVWSVQVKNSGNADAAGFVVSQNYDRQQAVIGLSVGQTSTLYFPFIGAPGATAAPGQPTLSAAYSNFIADYDNSVSESNESNNTTRSAIPTFTRTVTPQGGATRVYCKATATPGTPTPSKTPTLTPVISITRTPTVSPTPTRSQTPSATPTCGCMPPPCSTTPTVITAPFSFDGAGTFCWQANTLGTYINSWNTGSVTVNSVNYTNLYAAVSSLPSKIGGYWYISYTSAVAWGHFEAK